MPREQLQARCDPDTIEKVEKLAEEKGISKSEAVRRLIRSGIEAEAAEEGELRRAGAASGVLVMILVVALLTFVLTAVNLIGGTI
jgi:hypothetical protein